MCRALTVLCVAEDAESLLALKRASVSADWELAPGACSEAEALEQLESEHPHVVVVFGAFGPLVEAIRDRVPYVRIVADRDLPGANAVVASLAEVRAAVTGLPRPGGPVRGG